ncbi:MAG: rSAM/selenodomain-associated transferase 1 [Crocinitomicaceae bacterium]|jgi:rSAM/selenodomain-associated transferase 1
MNSNCLLVVFVKNAVKGNAKTRLAASIGDDAALEVYHHLIGITERETLAVNECDVHIYFSSEIDESLWPGKQKYVQQGADLGERMMDAFVRGFELGYDRIIGIGSDLPDLNEKSFTEAFEKLKTGDAIFGPSDDGGYYLIGMRELLPCVFENKPWSTSELLELTLAELREKGHSINLLPTLNDVDTLEDLKTSSIAGKFERFWISIDRS